MRTLAFAPALLAASSVSTGEPVHLLTGLWGGPMVALEVGTGSAVLRESCGEIALDSVHLDAEGRFATRGRMTSYARGPQLADEPASTTSVAVTGRIEGETMVLSIAEPGAPVRELTLHKGRRAKVIRCY